MIALAQVTVRFGAQAALDGVSFAARAGVLGLLGPNGAGKTTALRVAAGVLAPSSGRVERAPAATVAWLPEGAPAYPEMRAVEYLHFRATLKGIPRAQWRARVDEAVELAGAGDALPRLIGQLSRGFRQRVGLADALVARPSVLLLDEPTDGLDPAQRVSLLALLRALGRDRAVVLSTHALAEVEAACDRVAILVAGRVVADGTLAEVAGGGFRVGARGPSEAIAKALRALPGVRSVEAAGDSFRVLGDDVRPLAARAVAEAGGALYALAPLDLADAFARFTDGSAR